jgi:NAD(P)-dependent dehydrogenase (short-subunit alcohol dehydrogenase family)
VAEIERGAVLVTGSSTGIGRATALKLDGIGFTAFAGVRKQADADSLRSEGSERLEPLIIDVTDRATIAAAAYRIRELTGGRLSGLVNNAGVAVPGPLEYVEIDDFRTQLEVNVVGQLAVIQAFLPMLRAAGGRIVNLSSIGGRIGVPVNGSYSTSKFAIEGLSDALRRELRKQGVWVSIIEPGAVATPIWEKAGAEGERLAAELPPEAHENYGHLIRAIQTEVPRLAETGVPPEEVADRIVHALTSKRPRTRYMIGREARMRWAVAKRVPDRVMDSLIARTLND